MLNCRRQSGFTLIEVLIALLVFVIASAAIMAGIQNLDAANARSRTIDNSEIIASNLAAVVSGNDTLITQIGSGKNLDQQSTGTDPISQWWLQSKMLNPFLQTATLAMVPTTCQPKQDCSITISLVSKPPYSTADITKNYQFQVSYQ